MRHDKPDHDEAERHAENPRGNVTHVRLLGRSKAKIEPLGISVPNLHALWSMDELIREHHVKVRTSDGLTYVPSTHACRHIDGTWEAWLEFEPLEDEAPLLITGRETTQATRYAVEEWASGLEATYFEGAFERAHLPPR